MSTRRRTYGLLSLLGSMRYLGTVYVSDGWGDSYTFKVTPSSTGSYLVIISGYHGGNIGLANDVIQSIIALTDENNNQNSYGSGFISVKSSNDTNYTVFRIYISSSGEGRVWPMGTNNASKSNYFLANSLSVFEIEDARS